MAINNDKPKLWKADITKSVDFYNKWFMEFAPKAFRDTRITTAKQVETALVHTDMLKDISVDILNKHPEVLPMLRMATCPPIARDRLTGLAGVPKNLVESMEKDSRIPPRMDLKTLSDNLTSIGNIIKKMADPDIFVWFNRAIPATQDELDRAATIIADRLCGAVADPIIRNAQEERQLAAIEKWLSKHGYKKAIKDNKFDDMEPGTFSFHTNVPVTNPDGGKVNVSVDIVILPKFAKHGGFPVLIEAKSAGDFTNVNKRRKEEAQKMTQFRSTYGDKVNYGLFLNGYFDSGYLGYEAAEGIDWVWEHRIEDLEQYGL
ncbi:hypothetical protein AGMMS49983_02980 [Clostridia bacterium]|nr:hypothetical protein AGMMS49983_02980 [Clostridia bacterium]